MTKKTEKTLLWSAGILAAAFVFIPQTRMLYFAPMLWLAEMRNRIPSGEKSRLAPR